MTPIYDRRISQVAWFDGQHVFDMNLSWIAFHSNGHVFSSSTLAWLGPLRDGSFLDKEGKPLAWLAGSRPSGSFSPITPSLPLMPLTPLPPQEPLLLPKQRKPPDPLGGWSQLPWSQWVESVAIISAGDNEASATARRGRAEKVSIGEIRLEDVEPFRECLDTVAREKRYIAVFEAPPIEQMRSFIADHVARGTPWLVARESRRVIGWCDIQPAWHHALRHCGSLGMGLIRDYRGMGLGRRLLDACLDRAASRPGLSRIELEVRVDNARALQLYGEAGFMIEGRKQSRMQVDGECIDTFVMAKLLGR